MPRLASVEELRELAAAYVALVTGEYGKLVLPEWLLIGLRNRDIPLLPHIVQNIE